MDNTISPVCSPVAPNSPETNDETLYTNTVTNEHVSDTNPITRDIVIDTLKRCRASNMLATKFVCRNYSRYPNETVRDFITEVVKNELAYSNGVPYRLLYIIKEYARISTDTCKFTFSHCEEYKCMFYRFCNNDDPRCFCKNDDLWNESSNICDLCDMCRIMSDEYFPKYYYNFLNRFKNNTSNWYNSNWFNAIMKLGTSVDNIVNELEIQNESDEGFALYHPDAPNEKIYKNTITPSYFAETVQKFL